MPANDDHPIFDHHYHHGTEHNVTHEHDDHPRHRHDANGSIHYVNDLVIGPVKPPAEFDNAALIRRINDILFTDDPIGCGGSDIDRRAGTPR